MSITSDVLKLAGDKKFTDFSDAIKTELKSKMANHETNKNYQTEFDRLQNMKDIFKQISQPNI